jgi:hypothetical protein
MALGDDSGGGAIDPGPNYATEILDLRDKYEDVNVPSQTPGITRENAATSGWNFNCLPGVGTPEAEELVRQQWVRERVGMLAESPVYARPEGDGSYYSSEEAVAMVAAFRERTGV